MSLKHKDLVILAGRWLGRSKGCNPVFTEKGSSHLAEFPDAIGWTAHECFVVECKTSKADLLANNKKCLTLGSGRYFLFEEDVFQECKGLIPEDYGILIAYKTLRTVPSLEYYSVSQLRGAGSKQFERDLIGEIHYLRSRVLAIQNYGRMG